MNLLLIASTSFMIALSGALVPGPLFTITVSESVKRGLSAGPLIMLGHGLLEFIIVLLILFGVAPFLAGAGAKQIIGVVGGGLLSFMGGMMIRDTVRLKLDLSSTAGSPGMHPVLSGIVGSISNPYWVVWWATIGVGYLVSSVRLGIPGVAAFFAGHFSADLLWYSLVSYAVHKGRRVMGEKGYRLLLYVCGVFLILFGVWFILGL